MASNIVRNPRPLLRILTAAAIAGGSLLQVLLPSVFVAYFLVRRDRFAASVILAWVGASLSNVALYIGDAQAQELPLLGGENVIHDWWYLLTEWDLLPHDGVIANYVRMAAALAFISGCQLRRQDGAQGRVKRA